MADFVLASYPDGARTPAQLDLSGASSWILEQDTTSPRIKYEAFSIDWLTADGEILFHFNPRPDNNIVALNSFTGGRWGEELIVREYPFPRELDKPFRLRFDVFHDRFLVSVDGSTLCDFPHRGPPRGIDRVGSNTFFWRLARGDDRELFRHLGGCRGIAIAPEIVPGSYSGDDQAIRAEANMANAERLISFRLFAVLGTWMEEDIVAATVRNAFLQGCERVYLVDNDSADGTVDRAVGAGAMLVRSFKSDHYDESERIRQMQAVVGEISEVEGDEHIWWLLLDADEFHHGPTGLTVREYLETLDRRFRIVGARYFNHFPSGDCAYVEGRHPLDFQPLCYEIPAFQYCAAGRHYSHPLHRWDRGRAQIEYSLGFHSATSAEPLLEPTLPIFIHHFPFRDEAVSRKRFNDLFGKTGPRARVIEMPPGRAEGGPELEAKLLLETWRTGGRYMRRRFQSLEAVYGQRWHEIAPDQPRIGGYAQDLRNFDELVDPATALVPRWY